MSMLTCKKCGKEYTIIYQKWCKPCLIQGNFTNCTSGNKKIDNFIQEIQLKINQPLDILFEWIPYNKFNDIKEIGRSDFTTVYSAIWKNGPLEYNQNDKEYARKSDKKIALKYLHNSQNVTNELLNEINKYSVSYNSENKIYGISQNPDTKDYVMVLSIENLCEKCGEKYTEIHYKWCQPCQINNLKKNFTNWTSENKKIDEFIQEMQLKINKYNNIVFEWIPYNKFNDIKEIGKGVFATVYSAIWKDGPLEYNHNGKEYTRKSDKRIALKCVHNSYDIITNELLNEIKSYSIDNNNDIFKVYGITQNPNTKDYIMVLQDGFCEKCGEKYADIAYKWCKSCQIIHLKKNFTNWTSGDKKIDEFIQEMQLKINNPWDIVFEWVPSDKLSFIKEIGRGGFATVYSAIWKDGPLRYDIYSGEYTRKLNEKVALKCLHNSQNITNEFLNEIKAYSINNKDHILKVHGISQNPSTNDYIMILEYAEGGCFNNWAKKNYGWAADMKALEHIIKGLAIIHKKKMVHRDFHIGNILLHHHYYTSISDMGLCGEVNNVDATKIYGVMPYVAPEILRGMPYTQAADIYSFGMVMYFVATGRQPFANRAHDEFLALDICNGIRPEITEKEAPKFYLDLMKRCWEPNPDNRPNAIEIFKLIESFWQLRDEKVEKQFEETYKYKKSSSFIEKNQSNIHPQAIYTSRLLNPYTIGLGH